MKSRHNIRFSRLYVRQFHFRSRGAIYIALSIFITSCTDLSNGPSAQNRADKVVERLEAIPDELQRETASVYTLNTLCTLSRLASGTANGRIESALTNFFATRPPEIREEIQKMSETLDKISTMKRAKLLGRFVAYDPGACSTAPAWEKIGRSVVFSHRLVPRMRANFCSGNLTYNDGSVAQRAITVASQVLVNVSDRELGPDIVGANASPVILGVEGEFVSARHPKLAETITTPIGDGMTPYGVITDIPCSTIDDSACDPNKGLVCGLKLAGPSQCIAYPVIQKDHDLILRGYNFWDIDESRLIFSPLFPGKGNESTAIVSVIDPNEPINGTDACPIPKPDQPTHNRAHFRVSANEGNFYKLRMYNHNGNFITQGDAANDEEARVIHVCYPESEDPVDLPEGTIRNCTLPVETCIDDGLNCSATWGTPPRKLENCRHLPGEPEKCGETPEWFASEPLTKRTDDIGFNQREPIVYVLNEEPKYELRATLQAVECKEETGLDFFGSDEPMLLLAGFSNEIPPGKDAEILDKIDNSLDTWKGNDYDSGERKTEVQLLSTLDGITFDNQVLYLLVVAEDDGFLEGFLVGATVIVGTAAIVYLTGGAALWTSALGTAGALAIWGPIMSSLGEDDLLGRTTFTATPLNFDERIASSHFADFLTITPPRFGALPALEDGPSEGEITPRVIHPFVNFTLAEEPLEAICNPGICSSGQTCQVNRCVNSGFTDSTVGTGFKERREFNLNGGHYGIDILWEIKRKTP